MEIFPLCNRAIVRLSGHLRGMINGEWSQLTDASSRPLFPASRFDELFAYLRSFAFIVSAFAACIPSQTRAENQTTVSRPFLSPIFAEHMVLQRDKPNRFWGWTKPGEKVSMKIDGLSVASGRLHNDGLD